MAFCAPARDGRSQAGHVADTRKTPVQAPRANAICERWIASARRECFDRILITGRRHLQQTLSEYVHHYNTHRAHRSIRQSPPTGRTHIAPTDDNIHVRRP
jgi:transposase InsO family protein